MNLTRKALSLGPLVAALILLNPPEASACGGCFVPPEENTLVTGHRMILSVGMSQSTLYDQIEYSGDPSEFAWVLPIKGKVGIGLSSDLIFNQLGNDTSVQVAPPVQTCPSYECPNQDRDFASAGTGGSSAEGGVSVIAQEVVGPYETVQLAADDPQALSKWLAEHGYQVPADIQPIVASYVNGGFNFLALKLVPGTGVDKMQPIRVTTPGAAPVLPLRMVAAGTGATTTLTLWVLGEGRYEPTNFPSFTIDSDAVIWDYTAGRSNYNELRDLAYQASNGFAWLTEASQSYHVGSFRSSIENVVQFTGPAQSGYGDGSDWDAALKAAQEDLDTLFAGMSPEHVTVTRLRAELSRASLGTDLVVGASSQQGNVSNFIQTTRFTGTQPACPSAPSGCYESPANPAGPGVVDEDDDYRRRNSFGACALESERDDDESPWGMALLALGVVVAGGRRMRRR